MTPLVSQPCLPLQPAPVAKNAWEGNTGTDEPLWCWTADGQAHEVVVVDTGEAL